MVYFRTASYSCKYVFIYFQIIFRIRDIHTFIVRIGGSTLSTRDPPLLDIYFCFRSSRYFFIQEREKYFATFEQNHFLNMYIYNLVND